MTNLISSTTIQQHGTLISKGDGKNYMWYSHGQENPIDLIKVSETQFQEATDYYQPLLHKE